MPNFLTKKVGPFPVGVYAAAGIAAIGIGLYLRKKNSAGAVISPEGMIVETLPESGSGGYFPVGGGGGGTGYFSDPEFTFEAPPEPPPPVFVPNPPTTPAVDPALPPTIPPQPPPTGQRPTNPILTRDTAAEAIARWNATKNAFGYGDWSKKTTAQRTVVVNKFLTDYNKNRPGGATASLASLKASQSNL